MKDVTIQNLLGRWKQARYKEVVAVLEADHPALTALMIVTGSQHPDPDLRLSEADCNRLANMLGDRRTALFQQPDDNVPQYLKTMSATVHDLARLIDAAERPENQRLAADMRGAANRLRNAADAR